MRKEAAMTILDPKTGQLVTIDLKPRPKPTGSRQAAE
jgi:hypothetical protein